MNKPVTQRRSAEELKLPEIRIRARKLDPVQYPTIRGEREERPAPHRYFGDLLADYEYGEMIYSILDIDPRYWEIAIFDPNQGEHVIVEARD